MKNETDFIGVGYPIKKRLAIGQLIKPTSGARLTEQRIEILEAGNIEKLRQIVNDYRVKEADAQEKQRIAAENIGRRRAGAIRGADNQAVKKWHDLAIAAEHVLSKLTGV